ncbi:hypothetical protein NBRC116494_34460 [Aurantivibrio plasticivorans]
MNHGNTISIQGLDARDQMVFSSLISLLSFKTSDEWEITTDEHQAKVKIIDCDSPAGLKNAIRREKMGERVIFYGNCTEAKAHEKYLGKPLRAADILSCLNTFDFQEISHKETRDVLQSTAQPTNAVRLIRWPDRTICTSLHGSSRLCAVLLKKPVSLQMAAEMTGLTLGEVEVFVNRCRDAKCIRDIVIKTESRIEKQAGEKHVNLFGKLRMKFGARG